VTCYTQIQAMSGSDIKGNSYYFSYPPQPFSSNSGSVMWNWHYSNYQTVHNLNPISPHKMFMLSLYTCNYAKHEVVLCHIGLHYAKTINLTPHWLNCW